jgi:catechol 2,3-dioxygenase-like lactoylglutathione lyase family enzyme
MIERIDHINLVVDDMPAAIGFYRDLLGMKLTRQAAIGGPWIDAMTGLAQVEADVAFLELPAGPGIELLHYRNPQGTRPEGLARPNTKGLRHFAFRVQDLDELAARVKAAGVRLMSDVQEVPTAQVDYADLRKRLLYLYDPEGNLLELCEYQSSGKSGSCHTKQPG